MPHKLAIFGTSGRTGRELAKVAGSKDLEVCGFERPTSMVEGGIINGRIVRGNFNELDRVIETIHDSEAVCCMIGPRPPYTDAFCTTATAGTIVIGWSVKQAR
jgi:putative NADH-flavin reductase